MKCKEIEKYLPLFPDDIVADIREEVSRHIQTCSKCRELAGKLSAYRNYADAAKGAEAPEGFERKVLENLAAERRFIQRKQLFFRFGIAISSAAVILAAFLLFTPKDIQKKNIIETNFVLKLKKGGKGPSNQVDFSAIDNTIRNIISETGSVTEESTRNLITGYYDYLTIGVPKTNMSDFIEKFNSSSAIPLDMPKWNDTGGDKIYMKIYFDMVNFAVGNFDGDKRTDIIAQFISGRYKGKWMLYENEDSVHFSGAYTLKMGADEIKYLGDYWMLSGDFDGDSYDDICLYEYHSETGFKLKTLLNNNDRSFRDAPEYFNHLSIPTEGEFLKLISGDADGNGEDDLIWIAKVNEGSYQLTAINIKKQFRPVSLPDLENSDGVIVAGDLNGDKYFDLCIKYPGRERGGETDILLNNRDFTFAKPYTGRLSFQGDYIFWCDDYNGDGFDDLIVKSGGLFVSGYWYVLLNNLKADFFREGIQFSVTYPVDVK